MARPMPLLAPVTTATLSCEVEVHAHDARAAAESSLVPLVLPCFSELAAMASALGVSGSAKYRNIDCPSVPTSGSRTY